MVFVCTTRRKVSAGNAVEQVSANTRSLRAFVESVEVVRSVFTIGSVAAVRTAKGRLCVRMVESNGSAKIVGVVVFASMVVRGIAAETVGGHRFVCTATKRVVVPSRAVDRREMLVKVTVCCWGRQLWPL